MNKNRIGIDLGGTKTEAILMDRDHRVLQRSRVDTPKEDYQRVLATICELVLKVEKTAGISDILPIGMGTPGAVSHKTGLMKNCNSTCLIGMPLKEDLEALLQRDVRIANDADCLALSESSDGAAAEADNVFGVILGTGAGGGICINQQLVRGINNIAGEWGHNPLPIANLNAIDTDLVKSNRRCYCGLSNCVESWVSGPAFETSYCLLTGTTKTAVEIVNLFEQHDPDAIRVMDAYYNLLALALSTVINILDPEIIVLGGGMSNINSLYTAVPKYLERYVFSDRVDTKIVKAMHGDSSGVRGAAWLWP